MRQVFNCDSELPARKAGAYRSPAFPAEAPAPPLWGRTRPRRRVGPAAQPRTRSVRPGGGRAPAGRVARRLVVLPVRRQRPAVVPAGVVDVPLRRVVPAGPRAAGLAVLARRRAAPPCGRVVAVHHAPTLRDKRRKTQLYPDARRSCHVRMALNRASFISKPRSYSASARACAR